MSHSQKHRDQCNKQEVYWSSALGSSQTWRRGYDHQHPFSEFLYGFQGQNRASATRHNMIGRTVHPLNWLVFREWGDKDFPCLKVSNGPSCGSVPIRKQVGSCPVVWEMLISLSVPEGQVFHDLPKVPKLTFSLAGVDQNGKKPGSWRCVSSGRSRGSE